MRAMLLVLAFALVSSKDALFRWSMATAYVGLGLLGASLLTAPINVMRNKPNPVSADLRRDIGIWAGALSLMHFVIGLQVHMKHCYLYWLREAKGSDTLVVRTDRFGFANHTGLLAVLIAILLLVPSNDWSLRRLGTIRWKSLQRWNYALLALVAAHGVAFQVVEKRQLAYMLVFGVMLTAVMIVQLTGYASRRARSSNRVQTHSDNDARSSRP
jgi:sulfoxide reductase heme-binding subunit YedZ